MTLERCVLPSDLCRCSCHVSPGRVGLLFLMAPYVNMDITVNHPPLLRLVMFHRYCITEKIHLPAFCLHIWIWCGSDFSFSAVSAGLQIYIIPLLLSWEEAAETRKMVETNKQKNKTSCHQIPCLFMEVVVIKFNVFVSGTIWQQ